jgi:hypothetical protein
MADTSAVATSAASAGASRATGAALKTTNTTDGRVAAILGGNSAKEQAVTAARAGAFSERLRSMDAITKRGVGVTGSTLNALATQADGASRAAEITAQAKMQRQAQKMAAIGNIIQAGASYGTNKEIMDALKPKGGGMSPAPTAWAGPSWAPKIGGG